MSEMQESDLPGEPGTKEGEAGHSESEPQAPSQEGREQSAGEASGSST